MSNQLAIAAVTLTLRNLILQEVQRILGGARVTTVPLDRARDGTDTDQINLFLYQTTPNAALRNRGTHGQTQRRGDTAWISPLALNLHYLVTAYGSDGNAANDHRLLGGAMKALHDHPLLTAEEIRAALPESDLQNQVEHVRLTMEAPSTEEMSKLWATFQTQYRISAAYQASVVLIDSTRAARSVLPVLTRGKDDRGVPALAAPFQSLSDVVPPRPFPSARIGDVITIRGSQLDAGNVVVRFSNRRLPAPIDRVPSERSASALRVAIGNAPDDAAAAAEWAPGIYTAALLIAADEPPAWTTNEVPFALAPRIAVVPANAAAGDILTVTPTPHLRESQRDHAVLLVGDRQIRVRPADAPAPPPQPAPPDLQFVVPVIRPGTYVVRLRTDGVDSLPIRVNPETGTLEFDPAQTVTIT
jgi:hypothetical protein